jgi:hypothetical protein
VDDGMTTASDSFVLTVNDMYKLFLPLLMR